MDWDSHKQGAELMFIDLDFSATRPPFNGLRQAGREGSCSAFLSSYCTWQKIELPLQHFKTSICCVEDNFSLVPSIR
jgi:hypothetical protein